MRRPLRILISSGPTREPIDAVRFLSNYSTGYLGRCLAAEALARGHRVTMVSGPVSVRPPAGAHVVWVERAEQLRRELAHRLARADVLIMAAAVSDFRPTTVTSTKLARTGRRTLQLAATPDILGSLPRRSRQLTVGFALESDRWLARARAKLRAKRLDVVVAQRLNGAGGPFGNRRVNAALLDASGRTASLGQLSKPRLARTLLDEIEARWYGTRPSGPRLYEPKGSERPIGPYGRRPRGRSDRASRDARA